MVKYLFSFFGLQLTVDLANSESFASEFVSEIIDWFLRVTEHNWLCNGKVLIQLNKSWVLVFFLFDGDVELFDTFDLDVEWYLQEWATLS